MKKKVIVALLALVLVFTFTSKVDAQTFTDISKHWAKPYIEYTSNLGYFTGYQDGTFKPNKKITRAEFVTILAKLKGFDNEDYILSMQDVKQSDWYAIYLNDLVSLGLVKNGIYFDASSLITRDEAFGLLGQLFPYKKPQEILTFADTSSVKRTRDISVLKEMGIVNGDNNNMVNPQGPLTRAEVASLIYNMMTNNIFINKADLASAKENNLFSFDFNAVGLINTYKEETVKKDTQVKKKTEHKVVDKYFVKSYEEALEKLRAALRNREEKFVFTYNPYTYKGEYTIASTLLYDVASYPEYFGAIENGDSEVGNKVTIKFKYAISKEELEMYLSQIDDMARELNGRSDYDKVKYIHDWIVNKTSYAYDQYQTGNYALHDGIKVHSAASVFKHGIAICQGYAESFDILAKAAGLETQIVTGDACSDGTWDSHAWNIVKVDGRYYHVDTTWDDPMYTDGSQGIEYTYFLVDDSTLSKDHKWDRSSYPAANSGSLNGSLVEY